MNRFDIAIILGVALIAIAIGVELIKKQGKASASCYPNCHYTSPWSKKAFLSITAIIAISMIISLSIPFSLGNKLLC